MSWGERVVRWFGRRRDDDGDDLEPVTVRVSREKPHTPPPVDDVEERRRREETASAGGLQQRTPDEQPVGPVSSFPAELPEEPIEDFDPPAPAKPRAPVVQPFVPDTEPRPDAGSGRDLPVRASVESVRETPVSLPEPADLPEPA